MGQERSSPSTLEECSLRAVASLIKERNVRRIVVLTGAGISTSAGIPDFRTPGTGLYANLARLNLPYPEAVFDISFFRNNPEPFYVLARELYPGRFRPTVSHAFISLLAKKDLLYKLFTQNIDCLERAAGVPAEKIIEAHGSFATQKCIECRRGFPDEQMRAHVERGSVPKCKKCGGLVKPDIVFFGEGLPMEFSRSSGALAEADLVLILGTSLTVYPFAALPEMCRPKTPRVLFNMEQVGDIGERADDVLELGPCDVGILRFAEELGWLEELNALWMDMVGEEEVAMQRKRQGLAGEDLKEVEDEIVESLTAQVEGIVLKDEVEKIGVKEGSEGVEKGEGEGIRSESVQGKETAEECEAEDKEALKGEPAPRDAGSTADETSPGLEKHLEMHLHQKTPFGVKSDDAGESTAEGTTATEEKPAREEPAQEKPEKKPAETPAADEPPKDPPVEGKPVENKDETSKGQEKL